MANIKALHLFIYLFIQVAALYYVGMAGHFGLGNTNTLATIDVAGAYIVRLFVNRANYFISCVCTLYVTMHGMSEF